MSKLETNTIDTVSGSTTLTLGGTNATTIAQDSATTITGFKSTGIDDNADATAITIDSSEKVGIGISSGMTHKLQVVGEFSGTTNAVALFQNTHDSVTSGDEVVRIQFSGDNDATGGHFVNFFDSGGDIGRINVASASTTQYATTSDYRLKENIKDLLVNDIDKWLNIYNKYKKHSWR